MIHEILFEVICCLILNMQRFALFDPSFYSAAELRTSVTVIKDAFVAMLYVGRLLGYSDI